MYRMHVDKFCDGNVCLANYLVSKIPIAQLAVYTPSAEGANGLG